MVNHGIATALMFLVAGFLIRRTGTASMRAMGGGVEQTAPALAGAFLIAGLAAAGLPGLSPFVSEMMVIIAAFQHHWLAGSVAVLAIVLAAIYALWMYQRTMTGPGRGVTGRGGSHHVDIDVDAAAPVVDLDRREVGVVAPLVLALVLFGFYPMPLLDVINPTVHDTLSEVGVTDPEPTVSQGSTEGGHP